MPNHARESRTDAASRAGALVPFAALLMAVFITAFLAGIYSAYRDSFPYPQIRDALRTAQALLDSRKAAKKAPLGKRLETTSIPAGSAPGKRWQSIDASAAALPVMVYGGLNQFLELCPGHGCVAVAFDPARNVIDTWPYRPDEIFAADITGKAFQHEFLTFDPKAHVYPVSVQRYANGDVLVNFQASGEGIFPFGMGISRIKPDGMPRWTRFDFSHHWSTLAADGTAYVPSLKVGKSEVKFTLGTGPARKTHTLDCKTDRPQFDTIQVVDGAGALSREIELLPILMQSNWNGLLFESTHPCDPLHLNYIDVVGADAGPGLVPGDLVLSLRNLSRFVIFDPTSQTIRKVVAGGFVQQHSVHHLSGAKFLIFDNLGGDAQGPASRVVELDLATGIERRVFPNAETPQAYAGHFSDTAGHLDISPDRKRVLASFTHAGRAFEIDIASGRLLAAYDNLHDLSSVDGIAKKDSGFAGRFSLYGVSYQRH